MGHARPQDNEQTETSNQAAIGVKASGQVVMPKQKSVKARRHPCP